MKNRRYLLNMDRDHLVHVLPELRVGGVFSMICDTAHVLSEYHHTVVHEAPVAATDIDAVMTMQVQGVDVLQVDHITPEVLERLNGSGLMMYNLHKPEHNCLGLVAPSVYYSYGVYSPNIEADIVVPCSAYAATTTRHGGSINLNVDNVVAPMTDTRGLRQVAGLPGRFTIGLITSDTDNKYPYDLAVAVVDGLPRDAILMLSIPERMDNQALIEALARDAAKPYPQVKRCPLRPLASLNYIVHTDMLVYGTAPDYREPFGRTVVEAMAMGKPVICERKGVFGTVLNDRVNTLLFDHPSEAVLLMQWLYTDHNARRKLGANGQLWAAWQDTSIHAGKLKRVLRMIGS